MQEIISIILNFSHNVGYAGIVSLMIIESSFIPFPSEIIIPPAAYLASQGKLNIYFVVISGIIGSLFGAIINYYLAMTLGKKIIYSIVDKKIFKLILLNGEKIRNAEKYFLKHGKISTFLGRFIPAIRQFISIPAGFSKMNFKYFIFYTFLGSGLWVIILAIIGYLFGSNQELIAKYYKKISFVFIIIVFIVLGMLFAKNKFKAKKIK